MRTFLVALALALPAAAGEPVWQFHPGQTYSYECTSEFHYISQPSTVATGTRFRQGTEPGMATEDPQWETVTLKATILAVGDDGAARIDFVVEGVKIETRFDSSGDHAVWDSAKSKTTDLIGYQRYQAILGHKFQAIVNADGTIREVTGAEWTSPDTHAMAPKKENEREERAAGATHHPTPATAWLNLLFGTSPEGRDAWKRTIRIPQDENLDIRQDGQEQVNSYTCVRSKMRSADKERGIDPSKLDLSGTNALSDVAAAMTRAAEKKGCSWFARKSGCMVKVELEGATEAADGRAIVRTSMKWGIELKERGSVDLKPTGETPSGDGKNVETK